MLKYLFNFFNCITNKRISIVIEPHYNPKEDFSSIPSWEGEPDYARKRLVSFPNNREGIPLRNQKKNLIVSSSGIYINFIVT